MEPVALPLTPNNIDPLF